VQKPNYEFARRQKELKKKKKQEEKRLRKLNRSKDPSEIPFETENPAAPESAEPKV